MRWALSRLSDSSGLQFAWRSAVPRDEGGRVPGRHCVEAIGRQILVVQAIGIEPACRLARQLITSTRCMPTLRPKPSAVRPGRASPMRTTLRAVHAMPSMVRRNAGCGMGDVRDHRPLVACVMGTGLPRFVVSHFEFGIPPVRSLRCSRAHRSSGSATPTPLRAVSPQRIGRGRPTPGAHLYYPVSAKSLSTVLMLAR